MSDGEREHLKVLPLAITLSAGLHLIGMAALDVVPGAWSHGRAPALSVKIDAGPRSRLAAASAVGNGAPKEQETPSREKERAAQPRTPGLAAASRQDRVSLPIGSRYYQNKEVDVQALPVSGPPLIYPELAYMYRLTGVVTARVFIDAEGRVESVEVVEAKPTPGFFEEAAIAALRQVRYSPAVLAGYPVKSQKLVEVTFDPYEKPQRR